MSRDDWYRNKEWNPEIEARFFAKLQRARNKAQYLRVQAGCLAEHHPRVALVLLDRYFDLGECLDRALAFFDQAESHLSLGATRDAIQSLQKALQRERQVPNVGTNAWSRYALLIATERLRDLYEDALKVLHERVERTTIPVEGFYWHAAYALINQDQGHVMVAKEHAAKALEFADVRHSGFQYHPQVGLVGEQHAKLKRSMQTLLAE
jgi:tetratricopeptide (TPR) repeat protein